jgi:UDP-galactopyranose mutase
VKCGNKRVACDIDNRLILPAIEAQNYFIEKFSCLPKNGYAAMRCSIHFGITLAVMCGASETLTGNTVDKSPYPAPAQTSLPKQKI